MQFHVGQLLKEPVGAERHYDVEEGMPHLDSDVRCLSPLRSSISLLHTPRGILCTGVLQCRVALTCVRCLEPFETDISLNIEEEFRLFAPGPEEDFDDPALQIVEQHILDTDEVARQDLLLALPTYRVCRPDCRGLCPLCGQNRNQDACTCPKTTGDPRWSTLQALRDQIGNEVKRSMQHGRIAKTKNLKRSS